MKLYIKASLNSELYEISVAGINGGSETELQAKLQKLLTRVPDGRYVLDLGPKGYNTGYLKVDKDNFKWLYNGESYPVTNYWEIKDHYIVLPEGFMISDRIDHEDDNVIVYEIYGSDSVIYSGIEDYEPMKDDDWRYCKELGIYYLIDYQKRAIYVKWKVI